MLFGSGCILGWDEFKTRLLLITALCLWTSLPAAAEALEYWRHTAAVGLSSGFHVSDADAASRSSVSSLPGLQTEKQGQD